MSKKTRKKSSNTSSGKTARAESKRSTAATAAKKRAATAAKPARKTGKRPASAAPKASNRTAPKPPKPLRPKVAAGADAAPGGRHVLTEGAKAPAFRLPRDGGETVSLADFAGRKLVLFFYPRANTPGCTSEAIDFTRLAKAFAETDTALLGVSADPVRSQEAFRDKHKLSVPLASDEQHGMLEAYGVWGEKSLYGKTFLGIVRTTVLIDAEGRIARIWRKVKVDGHADEVLAAARSV
ncbi:peroxiredoxin [Bradyrhizobium sp. dw_78]|uniref:peroxiredoxin n=1 Tax=Bradyrhizobium sp. dw_78 TaxID=2719793 RepID=UPI001BD54C19|nr:peroxiredoxin [Bradyrhizobium sp. dw_78]